MRGPRIAAVAGGALLLAGAAAAGVSGARALDLSGATSDPDPQGAPAPAPTPEALWAGPLARPAVAPDVRKGLDHHPALVAAAAARPGAGSVAGHGALAAVSADPVLDERVARRLRLSPAERAWALDPALADAAAARCPAPALGALCEPVGRAVVEAQVDAVLAPALIDPDPALAGAALAAACRLGPVRGAGLLDALGTPGDARGRATALRLRACTLGEVAVPALRAAAAGGGPEASVAVLELRRLGADPGEVPPGTPAAVAASAP